MVHKHIQEYQDVAERKFIEMCGRFSQKIFAETDRSKPLREMATAVCGPDMGLARLRAASSETPPEEKAHER
jgi:hypothetical protein